MKILLDPEGLVVTSFDTASDTHSYSGEPTQNSLCTREAGCYPSKYCSGGGCVITYEEGCMTYNYNYC
jgi:hypothetical protein